MKVVIVGGVAGGAGAAARLRRNDEHAEIILLERGKYISFANCGLPYYIGGVIEDEAELLLHTPESFHARTGADVRVRHEVTAVDPVRRTVKIKNLDAGADYEETYDKLILSPGARAVRPPIQGTDQSHVFVLRNMEDCQALHAFIETRKPRSAVVIGAGFIGVEMVENLHRVGLTVSLIEAAPHIMGALDQDMAASVHNHIRSKGVTLVLEAKAEAVTEDAVRLTDGRTFPADLVLIGAGVVPDTGFLMSSGIELGERGEIVVNERQETSLPDVLAVGDAVSVTHIVTGRKQLVSLAAPAAKQARIAADVACGMDAAYAGAQGTAIAKVFDMTVALTGLGEEALARTDLPWRKAITVSSSHAGYYPGATPVTLKVLFHPETGTLYGAQAIGLEGVDKRLDVLATALRAGMTVLDLQNLELAYAPPFSSSKDPVNIAGYVAGNMLSGRSKMIYAEDLHTGNATLLDIRTPEECGEGMIPGSISIPLPELRSRLSELDTARPVFVICQVGLRGHVGTEILRHAGFTVSNLMGGYAFYMEYHTDRKARAQTT